MNRTLLIARREYAAYAKTVGFWLSLLALPLFAVLGGGVSLLAGSSETTRVIAVVEDGPQAVGLAAAVRSALAEDGARRARNEREAVEAVSRTTGGLGGPAAQDTASSVSGERVRIVETPAAIGTAAPGTAQQTAARDYLAADRPKADQIDAVVFLTREGGEPGARIWTSRATDDRIETVVTAALKSANRKSVLESAGIDAGIVDRTEAFDPEVTAFSPKSVTGGEISFRDRAPVFIGLGAGFLLWSLIITGASILLNSVMEEKSNKILEVLLSSASATEILAGKVFGVALLTLTVMAAWGGMGAAALIFFAPERAVDVGQILLSGGMLAYFAVFMAGGYLMYAVLFAAIGAFCETPRDAQTLMGPIMMILVVPLLVMQLALRTPDAPVVQIMSWVPLFTPFLMIARLPSEPPLIEVIGAMAGMFVFALLMVWIAGRAFRAGALSDVKLNWKSFAKAIRGGGK